MPKSKRKTRHYDTATSDSTSSGEDEVQSTKPTRSSQMSESTSSQLHEHQDTEMAAILDEESDADESDGDESLSIRQEISSMSFEEIQELKEKLGTKLYNSVMTKQKGSEKQRRQVAAVLKRANKNRPREVSAKKPVSALRNVFDVKKKVARDPRFDDLSGEFNEAVFNQTYKFLGDIRTKEKAMLKKELANETDEDKRRKIQYLLKRIANQEQAKKKEAEAMKKKKELGKQLIERAKEGKKPYFLKKSQIRNLSLKEKYEQLKRTGKLDKYLERKRKKNAAKDKRHLPKSSTNA